MKALILAAGYATRLYPLTKNYPKSLLKVCGKPIIEHIVDKLGRVDEVDEVIVVTNTKFAPKFRAWLREAKPQKPVSVLDDLTKTNETRRGAIGDMRFTISKKRVKDDLLVVGGDNLFDGSLNGFFSFAHKFRGAPVIGVYDIGSIANAKKYGVIKLDKNGRIVDFEEKPEKPKSSIVGMCLYYFPKEKLRLIKEYLSDKKRIKDATGLYIDWLRKRVRVYGFVFKGRWFDIGDLEFLNQAKERFNS